MIYYVTGPLGAGKTYYAVRRIAKALLEGRAVVSNITLAEDWAERVAGHNQYARWSKPARARYVDELRSRYHYEPELELLTRIRVRGRGEGRCLLVLDEAHNDLNNRSWQEANQREFLRWITLARKKGLVVYVISQHAANTDAGLRRIATAHVQLINWRQYTKLPFVDAPLLPWPFFLAVARENPEAVPVQVRRKGKPLWKQWFPLGWHRKLYGTHQLFGELEHDPSAIWLPSPPEQRAVQRAALRRQLDAERAAADADRRARPAAELSARRMRERTSGAAGSARRR